MANSKVKKAEEKSELNVEELKSELKDYIRGEVKTSFNDELDKSYKRFIREKNRKIIFRNIIIILLLAIIGYLSYLLIKSNYLDNYIKSSSDDTNNTTKEVVEVEDTEAKEEEKLEEYIDRYSYLLDGIYINSESEYKKDYYNGNLTSELKNYITLNNIESENILLEDDYSIVSEDAFESTYKTLFSDEFTPKSFNYNDNYIKYISTVKSYLSSKVIEKKENDIERKISNIEVNNDTVKIRTIEVVNLDGEDSLVTLTYVFNKEKLVSIEK